MMNSMFGKKIGVIPGFLLSVLFGLILMIPGVLLLVREFQKPVETQQDTIKIMAYLLLLLGGLIAIGLGRSLFF